MQRTNQGDRYLTVREAPTVVPLSKTWYDKARRRGDGPPFIQVSGRVFYRESDLRAWADAHLHLQKKEAA